MFSPDAAGPDTGPRIRTHQARLESLVEVTLSTAIGFIVSALAWPVVAWLSGLPYSHGTNLFITTCFTVLSLTRAYIVRRWFERRLRNTAHSLARKIA